MSDVPTWALPLATLITGWLGGYMGASRKIMVLEIHITELLKWRKETDEKLVEYNEDLIVHDIEIQNLSAKAGVPRAQRQRLRGD